MGIEEAKSEQETREMIVAICDLLLDKDTIEFEIKGRIGISKDKCRPLRVEIPSAVARRQILRKARDLKNEPTFDKVYIAPDLTKKQQEEDKTLRDKLKEFKTQGVDGVKIRRGCIVKEQGGKREILFGSEQ